MVFAFSDVRERMNARKDQFKVSVTPLVVTYFELNLGCSSFMIFFKNEIHFSRNPFLNE